MYKFLRDKSVLYIEDEDEIRNNVTELIGDYFNRFHTANSGELGLEIFSKESIDIVIVDIELPKMSGIDILREIRKINTDIPMVIISAHTNTEYLLDSISFKIEQYIIKPLSSKKIRELLKKLNEEFSKESCSILQLVSNVLLDTEAGTVSYNTEKVSLTKKELSILITLAKNKRISYDEIDMLWEINIPSQNAVRSCIKKLRQKLPNDIVKTRLGFGYYIE